MIEPGDIVPDSDGAVLIGVGLALRFGRVMATREQAYDASSFGWRLVNEHQYPIEDKNIVVIERSIPVAHQRMARRAVR
jgi:hypothetical protein